MHIRSRLTRVAVTVGVLAAVMPFASVAAAAPPSRHATPTAATAGPGDTVLSIGSTGSTAAVGQVATGTVTIRNLGPIADAEIRLQYFSVVDPATSAAKPVASPGCVIAGANLTCEVYNLQPDHTAAVHVRYKLLTCGDRRKNPPYITVDYGLYSAAGFAEGTHLQQDINFHVSGCGSSTASGGSTPHSPQPKATKTTPTNAAPTGKPPHPATAHPSPTPAATATLIAAPIPAATPPADPTPAPTAGVHLAARHTTSTAPIIGGLAALIALLVAGFIAARIRRRHSANHT